MKTTIQDNEIIANKTVSLCLRIAAAISLIFLVLTVCKVLKFDNVKYPTVGFASSFFIFLLPSIVVDFFKIQIPLVKYFNISCAVGAIGLVFTFFGPKIEILLLLPLVISNLYFNRKINIYTIIITIGMSGLGYIHLVRCFLVKSDVVSQGLRHACIFGFLPFFVIFLLIASICFVISSKTSTLSIISRQKAKTISDQNSALDKVISSSYEVFASRNLPDFYKAAELSLRDALKPFILESEPSYYYFGYANKKTFSVINPNKTITKVKVEKSTLYLNVEGQYLELSTERDSKSVTSFSVNDRSIIIRFFNEKELIHFIVVDCYVIVRDETVLKEILQILANNIGIALKNLRLTLDLLETQSEMIYAFSRITDSKSHQTGNHIKRVSEYMRVLAQSAGFSEEYSEKIGIAAMMHDIGKIFIPEEILEKKKSLTPEEYSIIKTHVTKGVDLIQKCPGDVMSLAKIMIKEHHERWDGDGYLGLKGSQIHTISRLISIADVFDALISKRSYKEGLPPNEVYKIIVSESGHQFDPRIVEIFKKKFEELVKIYQDYKD